MIGLSCYILADTFFIAKALGANGLTSLNLAIPIYSFIHGTGLMLGMGGATKYTIRKSQEKKEAANHIFTNTWYLMIGFAAVFVMLGLFFSKNIVQTFGADEVVLQMSRTYLQVILLFAPAFLLNNVLLCFVRNDGAPQLSMTAMLGGSISNIILDYIFMFPLQMGIFGAVLATSLAPIISIAILSPYFIRRKNYFHLVKCKWSRMIVSGICSCGLPSLITELSAGIIIIIFNAIILKLEGNVGVAAYGVVANIALVVNSIYNGIAQGIQPLISKYYGMNNQKNAKIILHDAIATMIVISGLIYAGVFFGAERIATIFNSEGNIQLQNLAVTGLKIYFCSCIFVGFNMILSIYFTSIEQVKPAHILSLLRGFVLIIPLSFLLSTLAGMLGIWYVVAVTEFMVGMIAVVLLKRLKYKK
jgi:putative MATE family efflux protein